MNLGLEKTEPKIVTEHARGDAQQSRKTEAGTRLRKSFCSRLSLFILWEWVEVSRKRERG